MQHMSIIYVATILSAKRQACTVNMVAEMLQSAILIDRL